MPSCIVCDSTEARRTYRVEGVDSPIVVCRGCGLGRYHPMPSWTAIQSFYPSEVYGQPGSKFRPTIEKLVRIVGRRHIRFLSSHLPEASRVLDIGCGRGVLLEPLAELGFRVYGVELSEEAIRGADPRADIRIARHLSDAGFEAEFFDQIVLWHVFEHLEDPAGTLAECQRILRPGGRIVIAVPNFSSVQARWSGAAWFHLDPPRHLYHFPVEALRRLLERSGFTCTGTYHFSLRQNPFGWIQSALNRYGPWPRNSLYARLHRTEQAPPESRSLPRFGMLAFFLASAPFALGLSVLMAVLRRGATVTVVGQKSS